MSATSTAVRIALAVMLGSAAVLGTSAAAMGASTPVATPAPSSSASQNADGGVTGGSTYPGDPKSEALLTEAENTRLISVRSIVNQADITGASASGPYRLVTGNTYTLVLPARASAYTFRDLQELEPSTLVRQPDGSYLLGEDIVVDAGATLDIESDTGLVLRMSSTSDAFTSIVTLGGSLAIGGTETRPITISSWDPTTGKVDDDTTDGRSYIRVVGGNARLSYVNFNHLGFWSGVTGGVSLTGTQKADLGSAIANTGTPTTTLPKVFGTNLLPATGAGAGTLSITPDLSGYSYVSALIQNVNFSDDAFGLFVSSAEGVAVSHVSVSRSLVDGIVFHRDVTDSTITNTTSSHNAVDGVILTRATSGIELNTVTAEHNGHNGITIEGGALATGPNPTGVPVSTYGNNGVSNSNASDNAHYGIAIVGGTNMRVIGNTASNNVSGVVVSDAATGTSVRNNLIENSTKQGIALRNAGTNTLVQGNTIDRADIGIYARDAGGNIDHNTIQDAATHGITLVGATGKSTIQENTLQGSGYSAVDTSRTSGATVGVNDEQHWVNTKPFNVVLGAIFQPLTIMWVAIALVIILSTVAMAGRRRIVAHPYANMAPLSSFTRGVVTPEEAMIARGDSWSRQGAA
ncbi:MAG TPA: right-handed parallel beta-helix repeat-containing protein [Galbitalea sp.]|nr:right-handed parallel beta-helix repeat-containing protein [Galbitalea sp.]